MATRRPLREYWPYLGILVGLVGLIPAIELPVIENVRRQYFDQIKSLRDVEVLDDPATSPIVMVGVTDDDGGILLPKREQIAMALDRVFADGAKVVAIDLMFVGPDEGGVMVARALEEVAGELPERSRSLVETTARKYDPDARLVAALQDREVTSVFYSSPQGSDAGGNVPLDSLNPEWRVDTSTCQEFPGAKTLLASDEKFRAVTRWGGDATMEVDGDGLVRRYPLVVRIGCEECLYPSLGFSAAHRYLDAVSSFAACEGGGWALEVLTLDAYAGFPFDHQGTVEIDYRGTFNETFPNLVSLSDVVSGKTPPGRFKDKLVFIGPRSDVEDNVLTPLGRFSGFGIHAIMAHSIIARHWMVRGFGIKQGELAATLLLGILVTVVFLAFETSQLPLLVAPFLLIAGHFVSRGFVERGYLVDAMTPSLVGTMAIIACVGARYYVERQERIASEAAEKELSLFLSPPVVKALIERPDLVVPTKKEITILFSDIRGFTTTSEQMAPEALADLLREYLTEMAAVVARNDGIVDKYIGDAVMALFGTPTLDRPNHAVLGCRTAYQMLERLAVLQKSWLERGLPRLDIGVGLNTGTVSVGKMGAVGRLEYTCIGDPVNFASRVEGLTKSYGARILVGEATRDAAKDEFAFRDLGRVKVKGKKKAVRIYELLETRAKMPVDPSWITLFGKGMEAFQDRNWDSADAAFRQVIADRGSDPPSEQIMMWTKIFRQRPPEEEWDGTIERREK